MASPSRHIAKPTILPPGTTAFLRQRFIEAAGIVIALAGIAITLALISFHPDDPSLNAATDAASRNWLAGPGASIADILMQTMGMAAWLLPVTILAWGWQIGKHKGLSRAGARVTLLPVALLLSALALAGPKADAGWILHAGYGGITGDMLLAQAVAKAALVFPVHAALIALIAGLLAVLALVGAVGFSTAEWRQFGRWLLWLGHHGARAGAAGGRIGLRVGRWSVAAARGGQAALLQREPHLWPDDEEEILP